MDSSVRLRRQQHQMLNKIMMSFRQSGYTNAKIKKMRQRAVSGAKKALQNQLTLLAQMRKRRIPKTIGEELVTIYSRIYGIEALLNVFIDRLMKLERRRKFR